METLNLEQLGVQEMNAVEVKETDGGVFPWAVLFVDAAIGWVGSQDLDDLADAFNEGYAAGYN